MQNFNLIDHPWIPVRWKSSSVDHPPLISLHDAFARGEDIADLDCLPHERIALIRLLVCITHAAIGAPDTPDDWHGFGDNLAQDATAYLKRNDIHPHFNLLGDGPRFLQRKSNNPKATFSQNISKTIPFLASGSNSTLFDHFGEAFRPWQPAPVALGILSIQNFFIGGSMGRYVKGNGPALKFIHTIILEHDLLETILSNCLDINTINLTGSNLGSPTWQARPDNSLLSRLSPLSCTLWLSDNLQSVEISDGYEYLAFEAYRDPFATIVVNQEKQTRRLLRSKPEQAVWRDLHLLTVLSNDNGSQGALNLRSFEDRVEHDIYNIWVGELLKSTDSKGKDKAGIDECVESTFTLPHSMLTNAGHTIYTDGIHQANRVASTLKYSLWVAWKSGSDKPKPEAKIKKQGFQEVAANQQTALKNYWHTLDRHHRELITLAGTPELTQGKPAIGAAGAKDPWTEIVRAAALSAYQAVCPRTTPRQIQAYAAGIKPLYKALFPKPEAAQATK